jgi:hypothetical protein
MCLFLFWKPSRGCSRSCGRVNITFYAQTSDKVNLDGDDNMSRLKQCSAVTIDSDTGLSVLLKAGLYLGYDVTKLLKYFPLRVGSSC